MNRQLTALLSTFLCAAALILLVSPAQAGGWATIGITEKPEEIVAGQPFTVEFMVWQHGNKAVHELYWDDNQRIPITPRVTLTSAGGGQELAFEAVPAKQEGLFTAEITVPNDGEWQWAIAPEPLAGVTELDPLTVVPAKLASGAQSVTPFAVLPFSAGLPVAAAVGALIILGLVLLAARREPTGQQN